METLYVKDFLELAYMVEDFMRYHDILSVEFNRIDVKDSFHIGLKVNEEEKKCLVTIQI